MTALRAAVTMAVSVPAPAFPAKPLGRMQVPGQVVDLAKWRALRVPATTVPLSMRWAYLRTLQRGWDGEGADPPSAETIERAQTVATWAIGAGLDVYDVTADVLGGVGLYLRGATADRDAWVACLNGGIETVVLTGGGAVLQSERWTEQAQEHVRAFLSQ